MESNGHQPIEHAEPAGGERPEIDGVTEAVNETAGGTETPEAVLGLRPGTRRAVGILLLTLLLLPFLAFLSGNLQLLAKTFLTGFADPGPAEEAPAETAEPEAPAAPVLFEESTIHPDKLFQPYFGSPLDGLSGSNADQIPAFRQLLDLYVERQARDDNFTIRIVDNRTGELLEVFALEKERERYERTRQSDWARVDALRREETNRLTAKYKARGIPKEALTVKWGRANQVLEARERDAPFIEYELRLAEYLGLSLLATEIGTVETFNQDRLVSSVGARSRYQMMPDILRKSGIHHYTLPTTFGTTVPVYEEWHPLLTLEPAFMLLKGYVNGVGHEVPGISAYHTGPGNIYKVFQMFLTQSGIAFTDRTTAMDAYMWVVTKGYPTISSKTSFKGYSRGYVASGYGALRATQNIPIDTLRTFRAERVQLEPGKTTTLAELLALIEQHGPLLTWGPETAGLPLYERFRRLNPHIDLPFSEQDSVGASVPARSDIRLVSDVNGTAVRFFLPLNATGVLARAGVDLLDEKKTFRFDRNTYRRAKEDWTPLDEEYADLLEETIRFGYTFDNRSQLRRLADRFEQMALENPTHFRQAQLEVIETHKGLWSYAAWEKLAQATQAAKGTVTLPIRPPGGLQPRALAPVTAAPRTGR